MSQGGPTPSAFYVERQALTRSPAPPAALTTLGSNFEPGRNPPPEGTPRPGDGLVLGGLFAVVVSIYAWAGQTLTSGNLLCWVYNPYQALWTRCSDLDLTISVSGVNAVTFPALENLSRLGMCLNYLTSSVVVSGGGDVLVRLDGFTSTGSRGT